MTTKTDESSMKVIIINQIKNIYYNIKPDANYLYSTNFKRNKIILYNTLQIKR